MKQSSLHLLCQRLSRIERKIQASRIPRALRDDLRSLANKVEGLDLESFYTEVDLSEEKQKELNQAQSEALGNLHQILSVVDDFT